MKQLQFASQVRVNIHLQLKEDFVGRVLELPWAFISDESSLLDFTAEPDSTTLLGRIKQIYAVDVSDIETGNIADILNRIAAHK